MFYEGLEASYDYFILRKVDYGFFLPSGMCTHGQRSVRMVNTCVHIHVYAHVRSHTDSFFSYLNYGSFTKVSLMIPIT